MEMFGLTPLMMAAQDGDLAEFKRLLAEGADVNARFSLGSTALTFACAKGSVEMVKLLLDYPGIDVNPAGKFAVTPLSAAARYGHREIVQILLAHPGIDVNLSGEIGSTPLINAAGFGHIDIVQDLLKVKGINTSGSYGGEYVAVKYTPVTIARKNGHVAIVQLLEAFIARQEARRKNAGRAGASRGA